MKMPVPLPSIVLELAIVGLLAVSQQMPRAVTAPPPSLEILPPPVANVADILLIVVVETVAKATGVVVSAVARTKSLDELSE